MRAGSHDRVLLLALSFRDDPKIRALSNAEYRAWTEVLFNQLEFGNGSSECRTPLPKSRRERFLQLGLLDEEDGRFFIHAWDRWNGRDAWKRFLARERKRRQRNRRMESGDDEWWR